MGESPPSLGFEGWRADSPWPCLWPGAVLFTSPHLPCCLSPGLSGGPWKCAPTSSICSLCEESCRPAAECVGF